MTEKRPWAHWSQAEDEMLSGLTGDVPWAILPTIYRSWATANGLPIRRSVTLEKRAASMGLSRATTGKWLTTQGLGELLGMDRKTIRSWVQRGWLKASRFNRGPQTWSYIKRADVVKLARERPELFRGLPREGVFAIVEDVDLTDQLTGERWHRPGRKRPVQNVETGKVYPSICAAARASYVTAATLREAVHGGTRASGCRWRLA